MKVKKRKKRISRVPYSRYLKQTKKGIRNLIEACNAEEKERVWENISKKFKEENL